MFSPTATAVFRWAEVAIYLGGLALIGAWFLLPRLQPARLRPGRAPRWDTPLPETGILVCLVALAVLVGPVLATSLGRLAAPTADKSWTLLLSLVGFHGGTVMTVFVFAVQSRALPPLQARPVRSFGDDVLIGAAVFAALMPIVGASAFVSIEATRFLGFPVNRQEIAELFANAGSPGLLLTLTVLSVTLVPVNEEILFRAGLFRLLRAKAPSWVALLVSGLVFATFHFSAVYFVPLTVLGILLARAYEKSGSLVVPIVAHGLFNLNSILGIISGQDLP